MNKIQFLHELERRLSGLPESDLNEHLLFYSEMISDRMEDGLSEEEAVAGIGSVDSIAEQILSETPLSALVKEKVKKKGGLRAWEVILLLLGAPVWIPLLVAVLAVLLSVFVVLWVIVIGLWVAPIALAVTAVACLFGSVWYLLKAGLIGALFIFGAAILLVGLAILLFFACAALTKGLAWLLKKTFTGIKSLFVGKEISES